MGEALLQHALDERLGAGHDVVVTSAGIAASEGHPPSQGSVRAMERYGLDIRKIRSRELTPRMARRAHLIYCMETYQADRVRQILQPEHAERVRIMGEEVPDPLGSGQQAYDAVAEQIVALLPRVVDEVVASLDGSA
jgi:protein-tyrosine-phosphatase